MPPIATTAAWHTIHYQTFESNFPTAGWTIADYNGPSVGGSLVWDDNATRGYNSYWAAHPNDSSTYANLTDTWMRYGPFSLVGATSARFTFVYWLNSEANYDLFSWDVICNGLAHSGLGQTRSGPLNKWTSTNIALTNCLGKSQVYIRFSFKSDYNGTGQGVWVDNVKIEKYQ
jgi:hypothetical protein